MIHLNFIEIGTSDFATLAQERPNESGILIEPIKMYLDNLPDRDGLLKINAAVSDYDGEVMIHYIPPENLVKYGLPDYLRGCNKINNYHPTAKHLVELAKLNIDEVFHTIKVDVISFKTLITKFHIEKFDYLKIDTEGHDTVIINNLFDCFEQKIIDYLPNTIFFESNVLADQKQVDNLLDRAFMFNYKLISRGHDTIIRMT